MMMGGGGAVKIKHLEMYHSSEARAGRFKETEFRRGLMSLEPAWRSPR